MKKISKYITTICFLLLICILCVSSIYSYCSNIEFMITNVDDWSQSIPAILEDLYNEAFPTPAKNFFVSLNGGFQRLMGLRYVNEVAKLDNGYITYVLGEADISKIAENTVIFRNELEKRGIPFLYVNAPFKINRNNAMLPVGINDYSNKNADCFLRILEENEVNFLDLRDKIESDGLDHYDLFFSTDHHWTAEAGFWANKEIVEAICEIDDSFNVDSRITDISNYTTEKYESIFLGSAGRRVGPFYAGKDDFSIISPDFDTHLQLSGYMVLQGTDVWTEKEGCYTDTLIFKEHLQPDDTYYPLTYSTYSGGDYAFLTIRNNSVGHGLDVQSTNKCIFLLRDSFSEVVVPFLALDYDTIISIDLRTFTDDLLSIIDEYDPDIVLTLYNPGAYVGNKLLFDFH